MIKVTYNMENIYIVKRVKFLGILVFTSQKHIRTV